MSFGAPASDHQPEADAAAILAALLEGPKEPLGRARRQPTTFIAHIDQNAIGVRSRANDGSAATLEAVVDHYADVLGFVLDPADHSDLVEYLRSL